MRFLEKCKQEHIFQKDLGSLDWNLEVREESSTDLWQGWFPFFIKRHLSGGFKYVLFSSLFWGNDPIWRAYVSNGWLKPPTRHPTDAFKGHPGYRTDIQSRKWSKARQIFQHKKRDFHSSRGRKLLNFMWLKFYPMVQHLVSNVVFQLGNQISFLFFFSDVSGD